MVPLAKRGEPTEGGKCELWRRSWYYTNRRAKVHKKQHLKPPPAGSPCLQGEPNPCAVPLAKRENPRAPRGSPREAGGTYGGGQM